MTLKKLPRPKRFYSICTKMKLVQEKVSAGGSSREQQREQQRRQSRRQRTNIRGTATTDRFRTAPPPVRDFFLYRIDKDVTEKQIKDYLKDKNVQCLAVQKMSSEFAKFSSFKVTVHVTEVGNIMDADTWPEGAMIRKFTVRQQNQDNGSAGF